MRSFDLVDAVFPGGEVTRTMTENVKGEGRWILREDFSHARRILQKYKIEVNGTTGEWYAASDVDDAIEADYAAWGADIKEMTRVYLEKIRALETRIAELERRQKEGL